jgi:hypothetical protein
MKIQGGVRKLLNRFGLDVVRLGKDDLLPDLGAADRDILARARPYTMTSVERLAALVDAVRHVSEGRVPGAFVECGVWRGGSAMAAALAFSSRQDERDLFLYDTYQGMTAPGAEDVSHDGISAARQLEEAERGTGVWCEASLDDVRRNLLSTGYPASRMHFVQGDVLKTIPATLPDRIALLRLDTDWYESTRHELEHLFPRLHPRGILIVDDYGHWKGARKAVDEYFHGLRDRYYFHRIDYTGRLILRVPAPLDDDRS